MIRKSDLITISTFALTAGVMFLPLAAHAASATFFGPIVSPICNCATQISANGVTVPNSAPAWGCVLQTLQNIMNFMVTMATVAITIFIALAGFSYMASGGNPEKRTMANKRIMNAVIGLVIVLCAWLVVDSILKVLYNPSTTTSYGPWNSILVSDGSNDCIAPTQNPTSLPGVTGNQGGGSGGANSGVAVVSTTPITASSGNEASVRAQFAAAGVSVNHSVCTGSSGSGCTDVGGMQTATIQQVLNLSAKCGGSSGCGMVVTGGNEPGHASGPHSHGNGYKVDLRLGTAMDGIIQKLTRVADRTGDSPGPTWVDSCNNQYVEESDHWDVTVYAACSL